MADDDRDPTAGAESNEPAPPRSRSAAAQAASRARRMGSRPSPVADTGTDSGTDTGADSGTADGTDSGTDTGADSGTADGADSGAADGTTSSAVSHPATRTRVAGRRPLPGPRDENETDTAPETRVPTRRRTVQPPPARASAPARPAWLRWLPAGVAAALVVALAVVDVLMLQDWRNQPNRAERREQLVASVNVGVAKLLSYDYRHLDQDEASASAHLTGTFRDQYVASMDSTVKKKAPTEKAVVVGEVGSAAMTSVSGDGKQAVLLVLGQQTVTNVKQTTPRNEVVSLRVTAQLVHSKWLVSDLARL